MRWCDVWETKLENSGQKEKIFNAELRNTANQTKVQNLSMILKSFYGICRGNELLFIWVQLTLLRPITNFLLREIKAKKVCKGIDIKTKTDIKTEFLLFTLFAQLKLPEIRKGFIGKNIFLGWLTE